MHYAEQSTAYVAAQTAGKLFRIGLDALANRYLNRVYELHAQGLAALSSRAQLQLELELPELHVRQVRGDKIGMADLLLYRLSPLLRRELPGDAPAELDGSADDVE